MAAFALTKPAMEMLSDVLENYLMRRCSGPSHTSRAKRRGLQDFFENCKGSNLPVLEITSEHIRYWVRSAQDRGYSPATVQVRFAFVAKFFKDLERQIPGFFSPCHEVSVPKVFYGTPKRASKSQLEVIKEHIASQDSEDYDTLKVLVAFQIFADTGLRADELRRLEIRHIDLARRTFVGLSGKGTATYPIAFSERVAFALETFLEVRDEHLHKNGFRYASVPKQIRDRYPLFASTFRASSKDPNRPDLWRYSNRTIYEWIAGLGRLSGEHLHPHQLRHTFGDRVMKATKCVRRTARALRHSDLSTTMRYTELTEDDVREVINSEGFDEI